MRYTRDEYESFLSIELDTQLQDFKQIENTKKEKKIRAPWTGTLSGAGAAGLRRTHAECSLPGLLRR